MTSPLRIHKLAQQEIDRVLRWYGRRSIGAALRLRDLIREGLKTITETPGSWPAFHDSVRGYKVQGFPHVFVYSMEPNEVFFDCLSAYQPPTWLLEEAA